MSGNEYRLSEENRGGHSLQREIKHPDSVHRKRGRRDAAGHADSTSQTVPSQERVFPLLGQRGTANRSWNDHAYMISRTRACTPICFVDSLR